MTTPGTSGTVTSTGISTTTREAIEGAATKILGDIECKNIFAEEVPPITMWTQYNDFLGVHEGLDQHHLEAWFISRLGIQHDSGTLGTWSQYQQEHTMRITGWVWHGTFSESYHYIQNKTEELLWTLEKNKGFTTSLVNEVRGIRTKFPPFRQVGDASLLTSVPQFSLLMTLTESAGRV